MNKGENEFEASLKGVMSLVCGYHTTPINDAAVERIPQMSSKGAVCGYHTAPIDDATA